MREMLQNLGPLLPLRQSMGRQKEGATSGSAIPTYLKQPLLYNNNGRNTNNPGDWKG